MYVKKLYNLNLRKKLNVCKKLYNLNLRKKLNVHKKIVQFEFM